MKDRNHQKSDEKHQRQIDRDNHNERGQETILDEKQRPIQIPFYVELFLRQNGIQSAVRNPQKQNQDGRNNDLGLVTDRLNLRPAQNNAERQKGKNNTLNFQKSRHIRVPLIRPVTLFASIRKNG